MAGEAKRRAALKAAPGTTSLQAEATALQLASIGSAESERELEQQLLFHSRRARALAAEVAKGNAIIAGKDARIAELEKLTAKLTTAKAPAKK